MVESGFEDESIPAYNIGRHSNALVERNLKAVVEQGAGNSLLTTSGMMKLSVLKK